MVLPQPFGPMMPIRSPRMMRAEKSRITARAPKAWLTFSRLEHQLAGPLRILHAHRPGPCVPGARRPMHAQPLSARTRPSLRVRRASMPWRIHASSWRQLLVEQRVCSRFGLEQVLLALHEIVVIAVPVEQAAAVQLDDAGGQLCRKARSWVTNSSAAPELQRMSSSQRSRRCPDGWWVRPAAADPVRSTRARPSMTRRRQPPDKELMRRSRSNPRPSP